MGFTIDARVPERGVELQLSQPSGHTIAVLGPNGAGKSTLLGLLSGLVRPASGTVRMDGRIVAGDGSWVPPNRRGIGMLAQDPLLFPHLSALENVAFGPRARGMRPAAARSVAEQHLASVNAQPWATRLPGELSGGQQQRVALARALATEPRMLLLDEPLSALDVDAAAQMRSVLVQRIRTLSCSTVLVTHDVLDVLAMAEDIVVIDQGRVVEQGPTLEVLQRPRSVFLARLAGLVLLPGAVQAIDGEVARIDVGGASLSGLVHEAASSTVRAGDRVLASFRPASVALYRSDAGIAGSPRTVLPLQVTALEPLGAAVRVWGALVVRGSSVSGSGDRPPTIAADLTPAAVAELGVVPGVRLQAAIKATEVTIVESPSSSAS